MVIAASSNTGTFAVKLSRCLLTSVREMLHNVLVTGSRSWLSTALGGRGVGGSRVHVCRRCASIEYEEHNVLLIHAAQCASD
jgi:hypothetical protein